MKKSVILISAVLSIMLSSCGTDIEQAALEPVGAEVTTTSQTETEYTQTTTAQQTSVADGAPNAECCTPQTDPEQIPEEDQIPSCCSPDLSQIGGCCGE
ncbi:MAG: hypothetical protein IJ571_05020 [Ruminococcus sp.]|nr:hypothetical protein [Ruminococcus sp.]